MPPYTPQQQFLAADQNPQDPQFSAQDHFFGALLRLLFLRIAEELSPAELEHFMTLELNAPPRVPTFARTQRTLLLPSSAKAPQRRAASRACSGNVAPPR